MKYFKGSLAVPQTNKSYFESVNETASFLEKKSYKIYASYDCHPQNHISFASQHKGNHSFDTKIIRGESYTLWPDHCIDGSPGSFIKLNDSIAYEKVKKGFHEQHESYSVFSDDKIREEKFSVKLKKKRL